MPAATTSPADHKTLTEALVAFQVELPTVKKGNTAKVPTKAGGEYKYQYADLTDITEAAMPLLSKHGLAFTSRPTMSENGFVLAYQLLHVSGESEAGEYPLPDPAHNQAQTIGSAITYARRYSLCAVTGIAPGGDDDDAQAAQTAARTRKPSPRERVGAALEAINDASDLASLDVVWRRVQAGGLSGVAELVTAYEAQRTGLAGTVEPPVVDEWATVEVPE